MGRISSDALLKRVGSGSERSRSFLLPATAGAPRGMPPTDDHRGPAAPSAARRPERRQRARRAAPRQRDRRRGACRRHRRAGAARPRLPPRPGADDRHERRDVADLRRESRRHDERRGLRGGEQRHLAAARRRRSHRQALYAGNVVAGHGPRPGAAFGLRTLVGLRDQAGTRRAGAWPQAIPRLADWRQGRQGRPASVAGARGRHQGHRIPARRRRGSAPRAQRGADPRGAEGGKS